MERNYRRINIFFTSLVILFSVLLFLSINKISSKELYENMDKEISVNRETRESFAAPIPSLSLSKMRLFTGGRHLFRRSWTPAPSSVESLDGLGPVFNRVSCSGCHVKDGRGRPPKADGKFRSMVIKLSLLNNNKIYPDPNYGYQLNDKSILGVPFEGKAKIEYSLIDIKLADGTIKKLSEPYITFNSLSFGKFHDDTEFSGRVAPVVFGLGLLEAISDEDILKKADPDDIDNDGISGRVHYILDAPSKENMIGKFGWKATRATLLHHITGAASQDMGLTSNIFPKTNCTKIQKSCLEQINGGQPEISDAQIERLLVYMQTLAPPRQRNKDENNILEGRGLFKKIGCENCHTSSYKTGVHPQHPELSHRIIKPYSDFLLHDMGEGLDDGVNEDSAKSYEWKTPPLWGIGLVKTVNKHTRFLHDGRAKSIEEAILWHGGEGKKAKDNYISLNQKNRKKILDFLNSL
ncbi:MAG: hypothetical protein CFH33_00544 [Alphaproteobacteria bacterium MarineAlpha9_Bin3]|nr:MAG: hypothetical protein CFH33_00544 [Alphaproteobacteria bacterium MarineAlpha9_Bin3]